MSHSQGKAYTRRTMLQLLLAAGASLTFVEKLMASEPHVAVPPYNNLSDDEEIALGRDFDRRIAAEAQIIHNPIIDKYLNGIVADMARASQRPNLPYNVQFINAYEVNAFSTAGGFLYLYRGLVQTIDTEGEMAATLSHEVGHIVARHAVNKMILVLKAKQVWEQVRDNLLKNSQAVEAIIERLGGALAVLGLLKYEREQEYEADMLGFYEMLRAHYQPAKFIDLFRKFEELERKSGGHPSPYLSDHPPSPDREARIRQELTQVQVPPGARQDSLSFRAFKAAMALLPQPPASRH